MNIRLPLTLLVFFITLSAYTQVLENVGSDEALRYWARSNHVKVLTYQGENGAISHGPGTEMATETITFDEDGNPAEYRRYRTWDNPEAPFPDTSGGEPARPDKFGIWWKFYTINGHPSAMQFAHDNNGTLIYYLNETNYIYPQSYYALEKLIRYAGDMVTENIDYAFAICEPCDARFPAFDTSGYEKTTYVMQGKAIYHLKWTRTSNVHYADKSYETFVNPPHKNFTETVNSRRALVVPADIPTEPYAGYLDYNLKRELGENYQSLVESIAVNRSATGSNYIITPKNKTDTLYYFEAPGEFGLYMAEEGSGYTFKKYHLRESAAGRKNKFAKIEWRRYGKENKLHTRYTLRWYGGDADPLWEKTVYAYKNGYLSGYRSYGQDNGNRQTNKYLDNPLRANYKYTGGQDFAKTYKIDPVEGKPGEVQLQLTHGRSAVIKVEYW